MMQLNDHATGESSFAETVMLWLGAAIGVTLIWAPLLNSIFCILFVGNWLFFLPKKKPGGIRLFFLLLFTALYLISIIGFFYSQNKEEALLKLQLKLPLLMFPFIFGTLDSMPANFFQKSFYAFSAAFCIFCLACFVRSGVLFFQTGQESVFFGYDILFLRDFTPSSASMFCILVAVFHLVHISRVQKIVAYDWLAVFISTVMLLLLSNRMGLLLLCISFLAVIFFGLRLIKHKVIFASTVVTLVILVFTVNNHLRNKFRQLIDFSQSSEIVLDTDASLGRSWDGKAIRIAVWKCAADIIKDHFFAGVGTGDAQDELQKAYEKRKFYFASRYNRYDAHNQYIQQWVTNGIAGFLLLIAALLLPVCFNKYRLQPFYLSFLVIFGIYCFTESMLEINKGIVLYSFFNSIFVFSDYQDK
jgi:O-antigen ligase